MRHREGAGQSKRILRLRPYQNSGVRVAGRRFGLMKLRIIEIAVALLLTLAAILFVGLTLWGAELPDGRAREATLDVAVSH
jgi:hypothetical protein